MTPQAFANSWLFAYISGLRYVDGAILTEGENGRYRVPSVLVVGAERAAVGASPTLAGQPLPHTGQRLVGMQGKIAAYVIGASGFPRSQAACQHERLRAGPSGCF